MNIESSLDSLAERTAAVYRQRFGNASPSAAINAGVAAREAVRPIFEWFDQLIEARGFPGDLLAPGTADSTPQTPPVTDPEKALRFDRHIGDSDPMAFPGR